MGTRLFGEGFGFGVSGMEKMRRWVLVGNKAADTDHSQLLVTN